MRVGPRGLRLMLIATALIATSAGELSDLADRMDALVVERRRQTESRAAFRSALAEHAYGEALRIVQEEIDGRDVGRLTDTLRVSALAYHQRLLRAEDLEAVERLELAVHHLDLDEAFRRQRDQAVLDWMELGLADLRLEHCDHAHDVAQVVRKAGGPRSAWMRLDADAERCLGHEDEAQSMEADLEALEQLMRRSDGLSGQHLPAFAPEAVVPAADIAL